MSCFISLCALLICLVTVSDCADKRNKICYQAKTCIHNMKGRCGVDSNDSPRRFFDSCDILEYNCLKGTDYQKAPAEKCQHLPPIEDVTDQNKLNVEVPPERDGKAEEAKLKPEVNSKQE